jgi:hypothetical protein
VRAGGRCEAPRRSYADRRIRRGARHPGTFHAADRPERPDPLPRGPVGPLRSHSHLGRAPANRPPQPPRARSGQQATAATRARSGQLTTATTRARSGQLGPPKAPRPTQANPRPPQLPAGSSRSGHVPLQLRNHLKQIPYQPDVRHLKDGRLPILVDRHNGARILDPREVLDRPRDPDRHI